MGFRFRKSIKIAPGVRLNVGTGGLSTSVGPRGARVTFGKRGRHTSVGIPGTGLSYTTFKPKSERAGGMSFGKLLLWGFVFLFFFIFIFG